MFRVDQPIRSCNEDHLGRQPFARALAEAILNFDSQDSIVLGLFGPWGSGKTSILNCVREHVDEYAETCSKNRKPVLMVFNPWNYSDQNQLVAQFFKQISAELKRSTFVKRAQQIGTILEQFSLIFQPVVQVFQMADPTLGAAAGAAVQGAGTAGKVISRSQALASEDPEKLRKALDKLLAKQKNKIIVVIDDIDRLNHTEIRQVFQLVKKLADFKNTVYLLAFDKKVVLKALSEVQDAPGEQYLEKIITVPFDIPNPAPSDIRTLLEDGLKQITRQKQATWMLDSFHRDRLLELFRNLRDVNRFLNAFRFAYGLIKADIYLRDLMVITAIQVRLPRLYDAIRERKHLFTLGHPVTWSKLIGDNEKMSQEKVTEANSLEETLKETCDVPSRILIELLKQLFPPLEEIYGSASHDSYDWRSWRREKRICSPDYFDHYFTLSVPKFQISQKEIDEVFSRASTPKTFSDELKKLVEREHFVGLIGVLRDMEPGQLDANKIKTILVVLLDLDAILGGPAVSNAIANLTRALGTFEERFAALSAAIEQCKESLYTVLWVLGDEHEEHEKRSVHERPTLLDPRYIIIHPDHLAELKNKASAKIRKWAQEGRLVQHPKLADVLLLWREWAEPAEFSAGVETLTESDQDLVKVVSSFFEETEDKGRSDAFLVSCVGKVQKVLDLPGFKKRVTRIYESGGVQELGACERIALEAVIRVKWPTDHPLAKRPQGD